MQPMLFKTLSLGVAIAVASFLTFAATLDGGAVATPDEYGAKIAAQILKAGGNAMGAAVTTVFTLAVTYPEAGNIDGGGFMILYMGGKPHFLDYREVAPKAASKTTYLDDKDEMIENLSLVGARAAGVPGTVAGLWGAHKRFGKLPWSELLTPVIGYAQKGFKVADKQSQYRQNAVALLNGKTNFDDYFGHMKTGEAFPQPDLAKTLKRIADKGPGEFYKGHIADLLVAQMQQDEGLITHQDLADYKVRWYKPMRVDWQDNTLYTAPLPSFGRIVLAQLLGIKEDHAADFKGVELNPARYIHLLVEIEKRVFADRTDYLGDSDFSKVPVARPTDPTYLKQCTAEVDPMVISPTEKVRPGLELYQTTHFSIVDADGNAMNSTYALNWDFGNGVVVKGAGFLLNDEMGDFNVKPGMANAFGVIGSDANAIEPGKRMLSSTSLSTVTRDGKVSLVVGTSGGLRVFTSIFQVLNNIYDFHLPPEKAVAAQCVYHQLLPKDTIYYDAYAPSAGKVAKELKATGYALEDQGWDMGDIQAIRVDSKTLETASDPRGRGVGLVAKP